MNKLKQIKYHNFNFIKLKFNLRYFSNTDLSYLIAIHKINLFCCKQITNQYLADQALLSGKLKEFAPFVYIDVKE